MAATTPAAQVGIGVEEFDLMVTDRNRELAPGEDISAGDADIYPVVIRAEAAGRERTTIGAKAWEQKAC